MTAPTPPGFHQGAGQGTFRGCDIDLPLFFFGETNGDRNRLWGDTCRWSEVVVLPKNLLETCFFGKSPKLGICFFHICVIPFQNPNEVPFRKGNLLNAHGFILLEAKLAGWIYMKQDTHKSLQVFQSSHATGVAQKKTYKVLQEGTISFWREPGKKLKQWLHTNIPHQKPIHNAT